MSVMKNHRSDIFIVVKDGTKWVHCVKLDLPVRLHKLTHDQHVALAPALYKGKPYPLDRACRRLLAFGKQVGITDGARAALREMLGAAR